jgi:hypothetical protein
MSSDLQIESTDIKSAPGVSLNDKQKTLVGSVLDVCVHTPRANCSLLTLDSYLLDVPRSGSFSYGRMMPPSRTTSPLHKDAASTSHNG